MNDPYSVLGVQQTASDAEIKKAYRELVRKYHPDNYHNNPLADLAQEKMKEINEAYDQVITKKPRRWRAVRSRIARVDTTLADIRAATGGSAEFSEGPRGHQRGQPGLGRGAFKRRRPTRNAEWHFLMGSLYYRKGWMDDALQHFQMAVNMDPGNQEYAQALNFMNQGGQAYNPYGYSYNQANGSCSACDICAGMMCANLCCNCF